MFMQGVKIISLLSDPFGWGWNLFGTAGLLRAPILPSMSMVWHTQVGLILFGHIVSVYIAHVEALRLVPSRARALASQLDRKSRVWGKSVSVRLSLGGRRTFKKKTKKQLRA